MGLVAAFPGGKHPCYGDREPIWGEAEELRHFIVTSHGQILKAGN